jgi:hypothetical protein
MSTPEIQGGCYAGRHSKVPAAQAGRRPFPCRLVLFAAAAPPGVNVFDITRFSTAQKPW